MSGSRIVDVRKDQGVQRYLTAVPETGVLKLPSHPIFGFGIGEDWSTRYWRNWIEL